MTFWQSAASTAQPDVERIRNTLGSTRNTTPLQVQRVCQLDASSLDSELNITLLDHAQQAVSLFKGNIKDRYKNEIIAILEAVVYGFALFGSDGSATYGARLQNLKYRNEYKHRGGFGQATMRKSQHAPLSKWQASLFCLIHVGGHDWRRKCWLWIQQAERIGRIVTLANLITFLFNGRYRTPLERILGMRLVYAAKQTSRAVSFEFLNRQLIWHAFTEFLLFIMPLINLERLGNTVRRRFTKADASLAKLPERICVFCYEEQPKDQVVLGTQVQLPYITNCSHIYCYYCIRSRLMTDPHYPCPRCHEPITSIQRVSTMTINDPHSNKEKQQAEDDITVS
ncbi:Pex12 amino terminal region-domain-containing protein [Syncephalis plumigaleata]|nr:Pex12 amino terminal region-domain-containing protein [Syncephalis plumigaleata]